MAGLKFTNGPRKSLEPESFFVFLDNFSKLEQNIINVTKSLKVSYVIIYSSDVTLKKNDYEIYKQNCTVFLSILGRYRYHPVTV